MKAAAFGMLALLTAASGGLLAKGFEYADLDGVLKAHVRGGQVDYRALKARPAELAGFLDRAARVTRAEYEGWPTAGKKAFLINLYNAATLKLVVDHYPVKSIKKIGGLFQSPWKLKVVRLWGGLETLDEVEHGLLRPMGDARIHAAIVCAAKGCPKLQNFAYVPGKLDAQLDAAMREFLREPGKNLFDLRKRKVAVSPIFKWFRADFESAAGSLRGYLAPFLDGAEAELVRDPSVPIGYLDYDWALNDSTP